MIWAVHISDGVLAAPFWQAGFALAGLLAFLGSLRLRDEEIPRVALLTAAFFISSLIHVKVGPTSVHLLLNGLAGVLLGWRVALAIPLALFLQALLFSHGGFYSLGVNSCVMVVPALGAALLFGLCRRLPWLRHGWFRAALVAVCALSWVLSLVYSLTLLCTNHLPGIDGSGQPLLSMGPANAVTFHPVTLTATTILALLLAWGERKLENAPEFPLGLLVGEVTVLATIALNCLALLLGGEANWTYLALILVVAHLPIAVVEGLVLGFTVGFLARVKPEMLGWPNRGLPSPADGSPE